MRRRALALWLARAAIAAVLAWNVECAVAFLAMPQRYVGGFELTGAPGEALVRGMGVLFLMWNVPYAVALWHPLRRRTSLVEALVMQGIGLAGESGLLLALPPGHAALRATTGRFILFDAAGVLLLSLALWLSHMAARAVDP